MKKMIYIKEEKVFDLYIENKKEWLSGFYSLRGEKINYYVVGGVKGAKPTVYYDSDVNCTLNEYDTVVKFLRTGIVPNLF